MLNKLRSTLLKNILYIYIYIYILTLPYQVELARYNIIRFLHSSQSPIAVFSSSVVHPMSSLSCAIYVYFCNTPVVISKYGVSQSGDLTIDLISR